MTLSQKQQAFTRCIALLIDYAVRQGFDLTFGDAYRDPRVHGMFGERAAYGESFSCHKVRLAVDFNLFVRGKYLTASSDYAQLGDYWKSLHPLARWGGDFKRPDGNHFSFEYQGRS